MTLVVETAPDRNDIHFLEEEIYAFNVQATGIADGILLAVFLRGPDDKVIGGAYGWTWGNTCYVRDLFVPENMQTQGHGTKIMCAIEEEAAARGCVQIVLETHSFQAPEFYGKLGFAVCGIVDNYPRGDQWYTWRRPAFNAFRRVLRALHQFRGCHQAQQQVLGCDADLRPSEWSCRFGRS